MKKDTYIIYGLTEEQLKVAAKEAINGNGYNGKDRRFMFNMFGTMSHIEADLTKKEAKRIRFQMAIENLKNKDNHYALILKKGA